MIYKITQELFVEGEADERWADAPAFAKERDFSHGYYHWIGGDKGDVLFQSFEVRDGKTYLLDVGFSSGYNDMTDDEVYDAAIEVIGCAFESIGIEVCY